MYHNEKPGLGRLWQHKPVFFAAILALLASALQLAGAYLFYLPQFATLQPFTFMVFTVIRWVLLSLPAYLLSAYLQDHYATEGNSRFFLTAIFSAIAVVAVILLNLSSYLTGFVSGKPEGLSYSLSMTLLLLLTVTTGLSQRLAWKPLVTWIASGLCACAMAALAVFNLLSGNISSMIMALSYIVLCVAYALALPKVLTFVYQAPTEENDDDTPAEAAIMKDGD